MNKFIATIAVGVLVSAAGLVYACGMDSDDEAMGGKSEMKGMMHHGMMMSGMMGRSVVATSDGGIVIVEGNSLTKYDRNLKLVNEAKFTDMPMDMKKKGGCGCKMKGMDHKMMDKDGDDDDMDKTVGNKGNITQGHEAHH